MNEKTGWIWVTHPLFGECQAWAPENPDILKKRGELQPGQVWVWFADDAPLTPATPLELNDDQE